MHNHPRLQVLFGLVVHPCSPSLWNPRQRKELTTKDRRDKGSLARAALFTLLDSGCRIQDADAASGCGIKRLDPY